MDSEVVIACGILLFVEDRGHVHTLLVKNTRTGIWEWPKGVLADCDGRDASRLLRCAARELLEEAGVDLRSSPHRFFSPHEYEYLTDDCTKKRVYLFPTQLYSRPSISLSDEHAQWHWLDVHAPFDVELHNEKKRVLSAFIADWEEAQKNASDGSIYRGALAALLPEIIKDVDPDGQCSWFWYGSWVASEQRVHPSILSDVDLIRFGDARPDGVQVATIHRRLTRTIQQRLGFPSPCGVFYQSTTQPVFERAPEWSYFNESHIFLATNRARAEDLLKDCRIEAEVELSNEMARLVWHRLTIVERGDSRYTAYQCLKGVIVLHLLRRSLSADYSFKGYTKCFESLTREAAGVSPSALADYVGLLVALDEKRGRRRLSEAKQWIYYFCKNAEDAISAFEPRLDDTTVQYCRICIRLIRNEDEPAYLECRSLARETVLNFLWADIRANARLKPIEMRLMTLCFLAALRVMLWPTHVAFASHKYLLLLDRWRGQLEEIKCESGMSVSRKCASFVRQHIVERRTPA
jgi:8-oxo-dGTP pyrophosphatase MutT (NUDIX family)